MCPQPPSRAILFTVPLASCVGVGQAAQNPKCQRKAYEMTAASASWMSTAKFREVLKRTKWHLQQGSFKHPLVSSLWVSTMPALVSGPAVAMDLHRMLVFVTGQTSCCLWHSSFIDGLFFNCIRRALSHWLIHGGRPSYWGPTFTQRAGSTTIDL